MFIYGPACEQEEEKYKKIHNFIEDFDRVIIDTLMVDREYRYNEHYRQDIFLSEQGSHLGTETAKKIRNANKALADYDSDEERENAHEMFVSDLQALRDYFIRIITEQVTMQEDMQSKFNSEREFFLECTQKGQNNEDDLKNTII